MVSLTDAKGCWSCHRESRDEPGLQTKQPVTTHRHGEPPRNLLHHLRGRRVNIRHGSLNGNRARRLAKPHAQHARVGDRRELGISGQLSTRNARAVFNNLIRHANVVQVGEVRGRGISHDLHHATTTHVGRLYSRITVLLQCDLQGRRVNSNIAQCLNDFLRSVALPKQYRRRERGQ